MIINNEGLLLGHVEKSFEKSNNWYCSVCSSSECLRNTQVCTKVRCNFVICEKVLF